MATEEPVVKFTYVSAQVKILDAPKHVRLSLKAIQDCYPDTMWINGGDIWFAPYSNAPAHYEIVGFDRYAGVLELSKVGDGDED